MHVRLLVASVALAALSPASAGAGDLSGRELLELCSQPPADARARVCEGYVAGFLGGYAQAAATASSVASRAASKAGCRDAYHAALPDTRSLRPDLMAALEFSWLTDAPYRSFCIKRDTEVEAVVVAFRSYCEKSPKDCAVEALSASAALEIALHAAFPCLEAKGR